LRSHRSFSSAPQLLPELLRVDFNKSARHLKRIVSDIAANWLFAAIISSHGHN